MPEGSCWSVWKGRFPPPYWTPEIFKAIDGLKRIASDLGHSPSSLALAWCLATPEIGTTLLGPRRPEHLEAARVALEKPIGADVRETLNSLFRELYVPS